MTKEGCQQGKIVIFQTPFSINSCLRKTDNCTLNPDTMPAVIIMFQTEDSVYDIYHDIADSIRSLCSQ